MNSSSFASWKTGIISGFAFFLTVTILSIGYATLSTGLTTADKVGAGSGLTATAWNKLVLSILELDDRTSNLSSSGTKVGIGTNAPNTTLEVNGIITAANLNQDPILSTQPSTRYLITNYVGGYFYTGESITITVPAGPSRKYRVVNRQMVNCNSSGYGQLVLSPSSNSAEMTYAWQLGGIPYFTLTADKWQSISVEGIITLAPGTYTYYVMILASVTGGSNCAVANESVSNRNYTNLYFLPL